MTQHKDSDWAEAVLNAYIEPEPGTYDFEIAIGAEHIITNAVQKIIEDGGVKPANIAITIAADGEPIAIAGWSSGTNLHHLIWLADR